MSNVQQFRQTKELEPLVLDKLMKSEQEVSELSMRNITCPYCGYLVEKVFSDISGHKLVYCKKCKEEYVINLGYFRKQKKQKYFKITFPDHTRQIR